MYARAKMQEFVARMSEATCGISGPGYRSANPDYGSCHTLYRHPEVLILRCGRIAR